MFFHIFLECTGKGRNKKFRGSGKHLDISLIYGFNKMTNGEFYFKIIMGKFPLHDGIEF